MAWTTPKTWATQEIVTSSNLNTHLRDNALWLGVDHPRCKANRTAAQSIANSTEVAVQLNATDTFDVGTMHNTVTNNTRITVPAGGGGTYLFGGQIAYAGNNDGWRGIRIRMNGTTVIAEQRTTPIVAGIGTYLSITSAHQFVAGDYIELAAIQTSGVALEVNTCNLWAAWQGF